MPIDAQVHKKDGVAIIEIEGPRIDATNSRAFKSTVCKYIQENEKVLLDCKHIAFVDSLAIASLTVCIREAEESFSSLKLCNLKRPVVAACEQVGLHKSIDLDLSTQKALDSFNSKTISSF